MLSHHLKAATQDLHQQAEEANFSGRIMDGTLSKGDYVTLLQRNYWLNHNLERRTGELGLDQQFPALELGTRTKTALLEEDLRQLDAWPVAPARASFPQMQADEMLGGLYVSEGSTLGGQVIRKALRRNPAFEKIASFAFFTGYGEQTGERWRSFILSLNALTQDSPQAQQAAVDGACKTFRYFVALADEALTETI